MNTEPMNYDETLNLCRGYVKDHVLSIELDTPRYKAFRMAKPGTRVHSVLLMFTPECITLSGDYQVRQAGAVSSCGGLDLEWFVGQLGSSYLASKFLQERWVPAYCAAALRDQATRQDEHAKDDPGSADFCNRQAAALRELADRIEREDLDERTVGEELQEIDETLLEDGTPGYDYDLMEQASLVAIQEKFAELYREWANAPGHGGDYVKAYESLRLEVMQSMEEYSKQLGWGITGAQPECWAMLDLAVEDLVKLKRELPRLATDLRDAERVLRLEGDQAHSANRVKRVLDGLKELGVEPYAEGDRN